MSSRETNELLKQLISHQEKASIQPSGAVTGQGIRNWWMVISFVIMGAISTTGWLVNKTVDGTKEITSIQNRLSSLEQRSSQVEVVKTDQQKLSGDVKELQTSVTNINKSLDSISIDLKVVAGQMQQVSNALTNQNNKGK